MALVKHGQGEVLASEDADRQHLASSSTEEERLSALREENEAVDVPLSDES